MLDDKFVGSTASDTFESLGGLDSFDGMDGVDTVTFASLGSAVDAYLIHQFAHTASGNETLLSIENLVSS